jgi:hypothetical protein
MGEAKHKRLNLERARMADASLLESLANSEREVARAAILLFRNFVQPNRLCGGCYLLSFFLHEYLARERNMATRVRVGWVNDGSTKLMASHAWLEFNEKKIDIALGFTPNAKDTPTTGDVVVLDRVVAPGAVQYTYHWEQSSESAALIVQMLEFSPEMAAAIDAKTREHNRMSELCGEPLAISAYLEQAPPDRNYHSLRKALG